MPTDGKKRKKEDPPIMRNNPPKIGGGAVGNGTNGGGLPPGIVRDIAGALSSPGDSAQGFLSNGKGLDLGSAAKRRIDSEREKGMNFLTSTGANMTTGTGRDDDIAAAIKYLDERQALAGLNETARFGGIAEGANEPAPGGGVMGGAMGVDTAVNAQESQLPSFILNTPLGRKIERDGWDLTPEDEKALQLLVADRLRNAGNAGL